MIMDEKVQGTAMSVSEFKQIDDPNTAAGEGRTVYERKRKKRKKSLASRQQFEVEVIPATKGVVLPGEAIPIKKVAAYCRVSTDEEAQASSFALQVRHYTEYIAAHENWTLVQIYADEGISGTQVKHRENFLEMIQDCKEGKIDLIITKSISRFARNVVDCLTTIRMLKNLDPPVNVYFEKESLYANDDQTEMVLGLMASIAQEESRSISANIRWATRNRMRDGTQKILTTALLGYDTDEDGNMVIIQKEADVVRIIFRSFVAGVHPSLIASRLNGMGVKTVYGNDWKSSSVRNILQNEKYCGDVIMQKTITIDYLTHKSKKNEGEAAKYYIPNHHLPIIDRDTWNRAQELLENTRWKKWKVRKQIRLQPVQRGLLSGFVSLSKDWKEVSITRLESASGKVPVYEQGINIQKESEDVLIMENSILKDFEVVDLAQGRSDSIMTVSGSSVKFNKLTAVELSYPQFVRVLVHAATKRIAIQVCTEKTANAIEFCKEGKQQKYSIILKVPALQTAVRKLLPDNDGTVSFKGEILQEERAIVYDLNKEVEVTRRKPRAKKAEEKAEDEEKAN